MAALVIAFLVFVWFMQWVHAGSVTGDDGVAEGYAQHVDTGGQLEAQYQADGPHEEELHHEGEFTVAAPVGEGSWPVVVMVNGTRTPASDYQPILEHLASWGFVVVGDEEPHAGDGEAALSTLASVAELEPRADVGQVGLYGHSQGGVGAFNAAADSDAVDAVYVASPASAKIAKRNGWPYRVDEVDVPVFVMAGDGRQDRMMVSPWSGVHEAFDSTSGPGVLARRIGADHPDVLEFGDAYATAWLRWQLHGDEVAATAFSGADPEIANNPHWTEVTIRN